MTKNGLIQAGSGLILLLAVIGTQPAVMKAQDLSKYRVFQLGTGLATVTKQAGADLAQVKVIHQKPALMQELAWRTHSLDSSSHAEPAKEVVFSFYDDQLFRIAVDYDRYETEGLTVDDLVESLSAKYGTAVRPAVAARATPAQYGNQEEPVAEWQDPQYRFILSRTAYGPSYKLIGTLKRLEAPAQAATLEAKRLEDAEAPQREAARIAQESEMERAKLEKARLINKPKFKP